MTSRVRPRFPWWNTLGLFALASRYIATVAEEPFFGNRVVNYPVIIEADACSSAT